MHTTRVVPCLYSCIKLEKLSTTTGRCLGNPHERKRQKSQEDELIPQGHPEMHQPLLQGTPCVNSRTGAETPETQSLGFEITLKGWPSGLRRNGEAVRHCV
jgi:hypothetical protein